MSLIAHYTLNGDATDFFGNDGVPTNVNFVTGKIGQASSATSPDSRITIPTLQLPSNFSVAFWHYSGSNGSTTWRTFLGTAANIHPLIAQNQVTLGVFDGSFRSFGYNFTANVWTHVAVVYELEVNSMHLYINGSFVSSITTTTYDQKANPVTTICGAGAQNYGPSDNDDFRIYDHALSEKEISDLAKGLATYLTFNDSSVSESTGNSTGIVENNLLYNNSPKVGEYCFEGDGTARSIVLTDSPVVTKSQTITMWLYPTDLTARRNPWNKNYGGEGTITQEIDGQLNYYYGTNGGNATPYQGFGSSAGVVTLNEWVHVAIVRDLEALTLTWYINGVQDTTATASYAESAVSTSNLTIGDGYTSPYHGRIDDVRQYTTALSADDIAYIYRTGLSVDNLGRMHFKYVLESGIVTPNLLDYTTWTVGTSGSQTGFSANGTASENFIVNDTDPFNKTVAVWEARPDATSGPDGGWNGALQPADSSKFYRFSVWIRRTVTGNGSTYFGLNESGGVVLQRDTGASNTNPYFWSGGWTYPEGEWVLLVGHLWPAGSGTGADHPDSGRYRLDGTKDPIDRDWVFDPNITDILHRAYLYYSTNTATRQQFLYPRIDLLDGTEPSINALLSGFDSDNYDRVHDHLGASDVPDKPSMHYGWTNIGQVSEVGTIRKINSFYPLTNDAKDRVSNEVATVNGGAALTADGYSFDGVDDYIISQSNLGISGDAEFTISYWAYWSGTSWSTNFPSGVGNNSTGSSNNGLSTTWSSGRIALDFWSNRFRATTPLNVQTWYHVAFVKTPGTISTTTKLYVNGVEVAGAVEGTDTIPNITDSQQVIGRLDATRWFEGTIRDAKVFDTALAPEEVAQEYGATKAMLNKNTAFATEITEI